MYHYVLTIFSQNVIICEQEVNFWCKQKEKITEIVVLKGEVIFDNNDNKPRMYKLELFAAKG